MIRILFFIDTTLASGGAEKVLRELVNNMDQSKFDITVQTLWKEDAEKYLASGIRYRYLFEEKSRVNKYLFRLESALGLTYRLHMQDDYDIEVAYLECGPTKILAQSHNKKAKKVAWVHCDLAKMTSDVGKFVRKAQDWYKCFDHVACVSRHTMHRYQEMFPNNTQSSVIYNTVDDAQIRSRASEPLAPEKQPRNVTFATVGRMYPQKGYDRLLEAHRRLISEGFGYDLWILGDGPERPMYEKFIAENNLEESVHLLGFQKNPYPFIQAADCIVCSSRYEGFSTVVTEAMILGKPVVTTPCSGMDELLGDNEFGLITEDSVEGIYQGMKRMLEDAELRAHYAQKAAIRGKDFSKEKLVKQTEQFFEDLLK